jgi:hypothetical protein
MIVIEVFAPGCQPSWRPTPAGSTLSWSSCERCRFPAPMRWLNAGGNLSRSNRIHQCVDPALTRPEHPSKCLLHTAHLPYMQTRRSNPVSIPPIIEPGASIKSP